MPVSTVNSDDVNVVAVVGKQRQYQNMVIHETGMDRFAVRMWRGNRVPDQKSDLLRPANSIFARADELAVSAAELDNQFYTDPEFATLFPKEIPRELPPMRRINHKIIIITESCWILPY